MYIGLGSNFGQPLKELQLAVNFLKTQLQDLKISAVYQSLPEGFKSPNMFLNAVATGLFGLEPNNLLKQLLDYEESRGRKRSNSGYSDRPIDLDILFFGEHIIDSPVLKIPHPHVFKRAFVVLPLFDLAPHLWHPAKQKLVWQAKMELEKLGGINSIKTGLLCT